MYYCCLYYTVFKEKKSVPNELNFPPLRMIDNSYNYAIFWYKWIVEGQ